MPQFYGIEPFFSLGFPIVKRATNYTKNHQQWRTDLFLREKIKVSHSQPGTDSHRPNIDVPTALHRGPYPALHPFLI